MRLLNSASELKVSKPIASSLQLRLNFRVNLNKGTKLKLVLVNAGCDVSLLLSEDAVESESPTVSATFQVAFAVKGDFSTVSESDEQSLVVTGSVIAWPYLRSFIQTVISTMGLPPVVLPLFHPMQNGAKIGRIGDHDIVPDVTNHQD